MSEIVEEGGTGLDPKIEAEARREGWKPLEEFKGPEDQWVDAETFVKRGREINPILRKNNERLQGELNALKKELDEGKKAIEGLQKYHEELNQKAYDRAMKQIKAEMREARREGNIDKAEELEDQLENLQENPPEPVVKKTAAPAPAPDPMQDPIFSAWAAENSWAISNDADTQDIRDYAAGVGIRLNKQGIKGKQFLDEITKAVNKRFPDETGGEPPARRKPGMVEGNTTPSGVQSPGKKSIRNLPVEAQQAYKQLSSEKWYQDLAKSQKKTTEQLYLDDYQE